MHGEHRRSDDPPLANGAYGPSRRVANGGFRTMSTPRCHGRYLAKRSTVRHRCCLGEVLRTSHWAVLRSRLLGGNPQPLPFILKIAHPPSVLRRSSNSKSRTSNLKPANSSCYGGFRRDCLLYGGSISISRRRAIAMPSDAPLSNRSQFARKPVSQGECQPSPGKGISRPETAGRLPHEDRQVRAQRPPNTRSNIR